MLEKCLKMLPETDNNVALSFSGGLDSTTLLHLLILKYGRKKVKTLSFNYGQRNDKELEMVKKNVERLGIYNKVIDTTFIGEISKTTSALIKDSELKPKTAEENAGDPQVNTYVPFRNLIFSSITASFAESRGCDIIYMGLNQVDIYGYWDTSLEFVEALKNIYSLNRKHQISINAPFAEFYKEDELKLAKELSREFGFDILEYTWSCYNGIGDKECGLVGKCNTCIEKLNGYILAGYSNEDIMNKFQVESEEQLNNYRKQIED